MTLPRYLVIDGGNSKTDAVIGTAAGEVLAYQRGPGTCHQNIGLPETFARLDALVARTLAAAGLPAGTTLDRADVFLAGADLPDEVELLTAAVADRRWARHLWLENDTFALLRAGSDTPDAVAVVCGAGINCVGRTGDGRTARFPSLGMISGDWGGGGHLGLLALWHAARAEDGRGPATALVEAVSEHCGLSSVAELSARLHRQQTDLDWLGELSPVLFRVAGAGDPVAAAVIERQAEEIVALVTVAARRLDLLDQPFDVVLGGGVLRARDPLLLRPVVAGLHAAVPKATPTVVDAPPVLGAALSSLDALAADAPAHAALRAALAARHPGLP